MSEFNYDSYCGIYCGACSIHMAYKTGQKDGFACYWTEANVKAYLENQGYTLPVNETIELKCHGCKSDAVFVNCRPCKIRKCAIGRNIDHCSECADYPCKFFDEGIANKDVLSKLPHSKIAPKNLMTIKNNGVNQWLEQQDKQWKCPECQTNSSWYTVNCTNCGKDLSKLKDYIE